MRIVTVNGCEGRGQTEEQKPMEVKLQGNTEEM